MHQEHTLKVENICSLNNRPTRLLCLTSLPALEHESTHSDFVEVWHWLGMEDHLLLLVLLSSFLPTLQTPLLSGQLRGLGRYQAVLGDLLGHTHQTLLPEHIRVDGLGLELVPGALAGTQITHSCSVRQGACHLMHNTRTVTTWPSSCHLYPLFYSIGHNQSWVKYMYNFSFLLWLLGNKDKNQPDTQ